MSEAVLAHRSPEEIGRTERGPRPLPPLGPQRAADHPSTVDTVLANGLRLIAVRRSTVPMVELRLRIPFADPAGLTASSEPGPGHPAIAEVLASTLLTGTERRSRIDMDTDLARVGGELNAAVDPERLSIAGSALASALDTLLDVLADTLTAAAYREAEIETERARLIERITLALSQPRVIAREALQRHRYGDHPFTREMPKAQDVAEVSVEQVRDLHRRCVLPKGSVLVLVGDVEPQRVVDAVSGALAGWRSDAHAAQLPVLPKLTGNDLLLVHRPGAVQSQIRLSAQALPRTDERYAAMQLANLIFAGYFSSRLVENIREDKGYTYYAHSHFEFTPDNATVLIETDAASEATAAALWETRYELGRFGVLPPNESEVDSARQYAIGQLLTSTASQSGLASMLIALAAVGLDAEWLRVHPSRLEKTTVDQVADVALEFFAPSACTGVVVGDADLLSTKLKALGGVRLPGLAGRSRQDQGLAGRSRQDQ